MADDGWKQFESFDWCDEGWTSYLAGLYPPPNPRQLIKFQKKWYKKHVDPDFDDSYEPAPSTAPPGSATASARATAADASSAAQGPPAGATSPTQAPPAGMPPTPKMLSTAFADGTKWQVMGRKASICFFTYAFAMIVAIGAFALVVSPYKALVLLVFAIILDLLAKYGFKLKTEYLHFLLMDAVGAQPILSLTMLAPGLHPHLRVLALVAPCLSALLSFSQICRNHSELPVWLQDFFAPLTEPAARFKIMRVRGHMEVALGFALVVCVFAAMAAPFAVLMFWNVMMMRYMMSHWTQHAFQDIDNALKPRCDKVPGVKQAYAALKAKLYSFVDPESKQAGRLCTIL